MDDICLKRVNFGEIPLTLLEYVYLTTFSNELRDEMRIFLNKFYQQNREFCREVMISRLKMNFTKSQLVSLFETYLDVEPYIEFSFKNQTFTFLLSDIEKRAIFVSLEDRKYFISCKEITLIDNPSNYKVKMIFQLDENRKIFTDKHIVIEIWEEDMSRMLGNMRLLPITSKNQKT